MKISREWLQNFFDAPLPDAEALADALTFHAFEVESVENVGLTKSHMDQVLDVKITANRGHDCLSHRGIAKELSAILNVPMKGDPLRLEAVLAPTTDLVDVAIDDGARCRRYIAGYIRGVHVGPSPAWLRERLESIGQRSINNVVDATNYVMFHLGQPLHAFDAGRLVEKDGRYAIRVRTGHEDERMVALDGVEYTLAPSTLVIADDHTKTAIGIAGVKGGAPASITEETSDIILESANFDGVSVRRTAAMLKLRTDASARFEQQLSPEMAAHAMQMVAQLILELAGGELAGFKDLYLTKLPAARTSITVADTNAALGTNFTDETMVDSLERLGLSHERSGSGFDVSAPFERLDLTIPEDLIEEVARIEGYDAIPEIELPEMPAGATVHAAFAWQETVREWLALRGFSEVFTPVFAATGERVVLNKVDGVNPYLRSNLKDGLREALERNVRNKDLLGLTQVKLFEIGTVWQGGEEKVDVEIAVENIKKHKTEDEWRAELAAFLESLDPMPGSYGNFPGSTLARYRPFSKYPFIVRDIALWCPPGTEADRVESLIRGAAGELAVRIGLFDRFEKDGRVSYAFRIVFQSSDRTLTDDDANEAMAQASEALRAEGFEIR